MTKRKKNIPLPKKILERMTARASLLYAQMRAQTEWKHLPYKKRNERFSAMLNDVLCEYHISADEWGLYKSILGTWLQKRVASRQKFMAAERAHYASSDEYPCADYLSDV